MPIWIDSERAVVKTGRLKSTFRPTVLEACREIEKLHRHRLNQRDEIAALRHQLSLYDTLVRSAIDILDQGTR